MISKNTRLLVLVIAFLATSVGMMGFAAASPLLNLWIADFGITHAEGGRLSGLWYLPGLFVSLPSGWLFDRYSIKRVLLVFWILIVVGIAIMAFAPNFLVICIGRLLFSAGMNAHMVGAPKLISTWFAGSKRAGLAMGLYTMSFPTGFFLSLNILGRIGNDQGWRPAMFAMLVITLIGFLLLFLIPNLSTPRDETTLRIPFNPFKLGWAPWVLSLGYFGYSIGTEAYLAFTPDYLVRQQGFALVVASALVGSYAWTSFFLKPPFSAFMKAKNAPYFVIIASLLAIGGMVLLLTGATSPIIPSLIMGMSLAFGMPSLYAIPAFLVGHERSGQVYGLYHLFYSLGFFAQWAMGYAIDSRFGYTGGYGVMMACCLLGLICVLPMIGRSHDDSKFVELETSFKESD